MKEFKFDVDGDGIAIPVIRCETQREFNKTVASYRTDGKLSTNDPDGEVIYIIYKDGSTFYHNSADVSLNEGKYKRTGILRGVSSNPDGYEVFGDFAIDEYGNIVIDEKSIEEYGVYAGQYDVKEQDEQEVQEVSETETNETTAETTAEQEVQEVSETETNETTAETTAEQKTGRCENGKTVKYTYEEAVEKAKELNARADVSYCKIYKGRTLIETVEKTVEETAENAVESAEVHLDEEIADAFEKQKTFFKFYDVDIAYQVERYVNCGSLKYVQLGTYSDYAKAVQAAQEAIEDWGEEHIYFHTVETAKRNSKVAKDKYDEKILKSEKKEIGYYWYASRLTDSKESVYISIDSPIRIPIETTQKSEMEEVEETAETETEETIKTA